MVDIHYLPLLLAFLLVILTWFTRKAANRCPNLPPGPWRLPLIGNIHHLIGALPHHALHNLSKIHGPIMMLKLGQVDHIIISSPDAAREILKTNDLNFASRPELFGPTIIFRNHDLVFAPYSNYWRQLRKICVLELFSTRRVKSFGPIREAHNLDLINSISMSVGKSLVNLTEKLLMLSNMTIASAAFGSESNHGAKFIPPFTMLIQLLSTFQLPDLFPSLSLLSSVLGSRSKFEKIRNQLYEVIDEIINEHQEKKPPYRNGRKEDDLVDVLLTLKEQGGLDFPFTMTHIKAVILGVFSAGTETSATTLVWAMAELMRHPEVMNKAQNELLHVLKGKTIVEEGDIEKVLYVPWIIKETLRLHPPAPMLVPRISQDNCNVGGFYIPKGTRVIINAWGIARDQSYWDDAESFRPERFEGSSLDFIGENFEYLPFGGGRRICPGMGFALASLELTLTQLLLHFKWSLPDGMEPEKLDMTESFSITASRKLDLCLIAEKQFPLPFASS